MSMIKCVSLVFLLVLVVAINAELTARECGDKAKQKYEKLCKTDKEKAKKCGYKIWEMGLEMAKNDAKPEDIQAAKAIMQKCVGQDPCNQDAIKTCTDNEYKQNEAKAKKYKRIGVDKFNSDRDTMLKKCEEALKSSDCK